MKFIRNIFAFLLIPTIGSMGHTFFKNLFLFVINSGNEFISFWLGILVYIVFQVVLYKPMRLYVFGHELSHAIAGILSGAKVKKFNAGKDSGNVVLNKDNLCITLAPYFFPIYTIIIVVVYFLCGCFFYVKPFYNYFLFFVGISIAFHIALTVYVLGIEQSDLKVYGTFFSYVIILFINFIVFAVILSLVFLNGISIKSIFVEYFKNIIAIYKFIYYGVIDIWVSFQKTK
ncbi:MAG: hypothetical protein LBD57_02685 [Endomicrobium sp.]|jgi:hypothetical protein|uniref:M50 family metallopeptidase n=1 Tax=Candidatus Endomicrobiellum cubanum TaxID=3242325 RepID=UPI0028278434|nr:hypothetical protein [Endomicrobium sp.]